MILALIAAAAAMALPGVRSAPEQVQAGIERLCGPQQPWCVEAQRKAFTELSAGWDAATPGSEDRRRLSAAITASTDALLTNWSVARDNFRNQAWAPQAPQSTSSSLRAPHVDIGREIGPGVYVRLFGDSNGWQIWRYERKDGGECIATKSAVKRERAVPYASGLVGGTPRIDFVERSDPKDYDWVIAGRWGEVGGEWRKPGEKFYRPLPTNSDDLIALDGKLIQIHIETWQYEAIYVGRADEVGTVNMTGIRSAFERLQVCKATLPRH